MESRGPHSGQRARPRRTGHKHRVAPLARRRLLPGPDLRNGLRGEPAQKGVNYWGYDPEANRFRIIFFSNNGPFTEEGNRYQGEVAGRKLTFEGPARFQYELDDEGMIKLNADGTLSVAWWLRHENGEWQPWMNNTFTKIEE